PSLLVRDNEDAAKLSQWLSELNPFPEINVIMSIDSGIVRSNEVNCHLSEEIGRDMISKMMGKNFENVKFKRKGKVVTLASINCSVKIGNISIVVDTLILFHRLCIAKQSDGDLKAFFKFKLSPFPISLFTRESMRKGTKSSLYTSFSSITEAVKPEGSHNNRASNRSKGKSSCCFVWGDPAIRNLDELRNHSFVKAAAKTKFNLARLPPTTNAAQLQAIRSYHQVQTWLGDEEGPLKWGWMHTPSGLFPKKAEKDPTPESLFQCICCTCKKRLHECMWMQESRSVLFLTMQTLHWTVLRKSNTVILDNESEEGDAPAPIDTADKQLEWEDNELYVV
ncbi:hypothetical protein AVEN_237351-1, partial [Araneus ventricosus]